MVVRTKIMTNSLELYQKWDNLGKQAAAECKTNAQYIYSKFSSYLFGSVYVGINKEKDKCILLNIKNCPRDISFPEIKGLTFDFENIPAISNDLLLKIAAKNQDCLEEAFEAFTVTLVGWIQNVESPMDVVDAIFEVVDKYNQFFADDKVVKLSRKEEQGLFGELLFLKRYLIETNDENVVLCWTGPSKNKHDFIFQNNVGVEIKTISSQTRKDLTISNENQLDSKERKELYLKLYVLEVNPIGITIDQLIESIDAKISSYTVKRHFMQKLLENRIIINYYQGQYKFAVVGEFTYLIGDDFPKISKHDLNSSVFEVTYKVNVDEQKPFEGNLYEKLRD